VVHKKFKSWGGGLVIETWSSDLPDGMCFVRILFQDGSRESLIIILIAPAALLYWDHLLNRIEL